MKWVLGTFLTLLVASTAFGQVQTRSVELQWEPVTTYEDGTDIKAATLPLLRYAIYYGLTPRPTTAVKQPDGGYTDGVDEITAVSVVIDNLAAGTTYFFTVTAYYWNTADPPKLIESDYSNELRVDIPVKVEVDEGILQSPIGVTIQLLPKSTTP